MNNDPKNCYETSEQNLFTRFETGEDGVYLLPYSGLLFAHLPQPTSNGETLTLTYITHTVTLRGTNLAPLLLVIQKGRAETIRVSGGQPTTGSTSIPVVNNIAVEEGVSHNNYDKQ